MVRCRSGRNSSAELAQSGTRRGRWLMHAAMSSRSWSENWRRSAPFGEVLPQQIKRLGSPSPHLSHSSSFCSLVRIDYPRRRVERLRSS
jgi:hypothetical protein